LRAFPSNRLGRVLSGGIPQEDLSHDRRAAGRPGCLDRRIQPATAPSGPLVLRQDADAHPPRRPTTGKGKIHGGITTDDSHNGSDCQHRLSDQISANTPRSRAIAVKHRTWWTATSPRQCLIGCGWRISRMSRPARVFSISRWCSTPSAAASAPSRYDLRGLKPLALAFAAFSELFALEPFISASQLANAV